MFSVPPASIANAINWPPGFLDIEPIGSSKNVICSLAPPCFLTLCNWLTFPKRVVINISFPSRLNPLKGADLIFWYRVRSFLMFSGIIGIFLSIKLPLFSVLSFANTTADENRNIQETKKRCFLILNHLDFKLICGTKIILRCRLIF